MNEEDTLFLDDWARAGVACREIRSHRAPSRHTGLKMVACVLVAGAIAGLSAAVVPGGRQSGEVIWVNPADARSVERVSRGIARTPVHHRMQKVIHDRNVINSSK